MRWCVGLVLTFQLAAAAALPQAAASQTAGEPSPAKTLHQRLQDLDRELRHRLEGAALHPGQTPAAELSRDAERLGRDLRRLERQLDGLSAEDADGLRRKLHALGNVLGNLERVAAGGDPAAASPRSAERQPEAVPRRRAATPANDDCADAVPIALGANAAGTTAGATQDGAASCGSSIFSPDVWYSFTAAASGEVSVDTFGAGYDTVVSVHTACPGGVGNELTCNDDAFGMQSAVSFAAIANHTYRIRVSGFNQATGTFTLRLGTGGDVSGTVTSSATSTPLEGGQVAAYRQEGSFAYYAGSGVTDSSGGYSIAGLWAGGYLFHTGDFAGFLDELYDDVACPFDPYGISSDCSGGTPVAVSNTADVTGIDFALDTGGTISGHVSQAVTGDPLSGVAVDIFDAAGNFAGSDFTDVSGDYAVNGLASGNYFAKATGAAIVPEIYDGVPCPVAWSCDPTAGTAIPVTAPLTTANVDFVVDQRGTVKGVVTHRATGNPIADATVEFYRDGGGYFTFEGEAYTGPSGVYSIDGLASGSYMATARAPSYAAQVYDDIPCSWDGSEPCNLTVGTAVAVALNASVAGVDFALDLLGAVSGTVTHALSGSPLLNVQVVVFNAAGGWVTWVWTDTSGSYNLYVPAGTYYVATTDSPSFIDEIYDDMPCAGDPGPDCDPTAGTPVTVSIGATTSGIDFALEPGGAIAGTVTEAGTGAPVPYAGLRIWDGGGALVRSGSADVYGHYTLHTLLAGSYFVTATGASDVHFGELYDDLPCPGGEAPGCDPATGTPVAVTLNTTTPGIDFVLDHLGAIAGTVTDSADVAIGGIRVTASRVGGGGGNESFTSPLGTYQISGLPSGTYHVFTDTFGLYVDEVWDDLPCLGGYCDSTKGSPVDVTLNATTAAVSFVLLTFDESTAIFIDGFESGDLSAWTVGGP